MDLSDRSELVRVSELVTELKDAVPDVSWFLFGAAARDFQIQYKHNLRISRATEDVDFAVAVESWQMFERVREGLLASERISSAGKLQHRFCFLERTIFDIVPFGGVQNSSGQIQWPPDGNPEMSVVGFSSVVRTSEEFILPRGETILVPTLSMLLLLKIFAWEDRKYSRIGVDASDIFLIVSNYAVTHEAELFESHDDLLQGGFDFEAAGARVAGRDLQENLNNADVDSARALAELDRILSEQIGGDAPGVLIEQAPRGKADRFAELLQALYTGLKEAR